MAFRRLAYIASLLASSVPLSCEKKGDDVKLAPAASALAPSIAVAKSWHFTLDPQGSVHVDLPGVTERITGDATGTGGSLDVVPTDLTQSRGLVRVDLATFATTTFGNKKDALQTKHARTWLEVQVGDKTNDDMRFAEFAVRSVDGVSASDLSLVASVREEQDDVRTVTMTVHGDLLVHGHRVPKDDVVDVAFHYPPGAAPDAKPARVLITSRSPMRVILKEHDVRPRDPAGQIAEWTASLISKVAETADVTLRLGASPTS
jgi:hypothetical protein